MCIRVFKSKVTSKKSIFLFASMVTFKSYFLKMLQMFFFFLIILLCIGVGVSLKTASPSSLYRPMIFAIFLIQLVNNHRSDELTCFSPIKATIFYSMVYFYGIAVKS